MSFDFFAGAGFFASWASIALATALWSCGVLDATASSAARASSAERPAIFALVGARAAAFFCSASSSTSSAQFVPLAVFRMVVVGV